MEASASADRRQTNHCVGPADGLYRVGCVNEDEGGGGSGVPRPKWADPPARGLRRGEACYSSTVTVTSIGVVLIESSAKARSTWVPGSVNVTVVST